MLTLLAGLAGCGAEAEAPASAPVVPAQVEAKVVVAPEPPSAAKVVPAEVPAEVPAGVPESPAAAAPVPVSPASALASPVVSPEADDAVAVVEVPADAVQVAPAPPESTAADYALVPGKNALYVVVTYQRGTLGSAVAHDHVVVATQYSGTVHWDPSDPSACRVAVDVPAAGLRVDPPGARARARLEGSAPVEDQPKIEENFNGDRQLDSARFPVLTFRAEACAARADGKVDVTGPLTVHGVSRPTTVALAITADGETFTRAAASPRTTGTSA